MDNTILFRERIPGGWNWSHRLKKGTSLKITDPEGGACCALLAYNPIELSERYNLPDTVKIQFTARLTKGHALYSDMGRILLSILEDSFGGHDPFAGVLSQKALEDRFGTKGYQEHRNAYYRSGKLALLTELAKYQMDDRDLVPNVNFFSRTVADRSGRLSLDTGAARAGASVVLQAEMDTLVVLAATQHPFDTRPDWAPRPLDVEIVATGVAPEANPVHSHSDQNRRGLANTVLYSL